MSQNPIQGRPQGAFSGVRRRVYLTYTNLGLRTLLFRLLTFPLRFTPLEMTDERNRLRRPTRRG